MQKGSKRNYIIGLLIAVMVVTQIFALPVFGTEIEKSVDETNANASIAETYNGTAIANNSVNLSYEINGSTHILNASSQGVKIGGSTQEANVAFIIGGYEYEGLIMSAMDEVDLSLNITIYRTNNIPDNLSLSTQDVIFMDNALGGRRFEAAHLSR